MVVSPAPAPGAASDTDHAERGVDRTRGRHVTTSFARAVALALVINLFCVAGAHATVVLGTLKTAPDPPRAGVPTVITIHLEDPTLAPVQDAVVLVDLKDPDGGDVPDLRLVEVPEPEGTYRAEWTPGSDGTFAVTIRDRTFRQEEAVAELSLRVGEGQELNGEVPFLLPPTPIAPRSIATWLVWLIGLPVVVGIIVTVLVLRTAPKSEAPKGS